MKICILIQVHKNKEFINRIVNRIKDEKIDIWVNADSKFDVSEDDFKGCYFVENRIDVKWGEISQTIATMNSIREILSSGIKYDRIIYISGQDYPIKPINELVKFFSKKANLDKEFISYSEVGKDKWDIRYRYAYNHYKNRYITKLCSFIMHKPFIKNYRPYGGSTWFNITPKAAEYILKKYEEDGFEEYFKYSLCIDELIFQSIIMNEDSPFKEKVINNSLRYIDWSDHKNGLNKGNPNTLTINDYEKIIESDAFFARKFDPEIDKEIIEKLDLYIDEYYEQI
ncbi:MAG: beta-1,6-N-acetylglucosaminyltransferase [Ruminococcaceae bacterium]|nr:beta-1,6-N-acetylglucosaminyltransferase [Oscillospiraceae bacterium]